MQFHKSKQVTCEEKNEDMEFLHIIRNQFFKRNSIQSYLESRNLTTLTVLLGICSGELTVTMPIFTLHFMQ